MWIAYPVMVIGKPTAQGWIRAEVDFFRGAPDVSRSFSVFGRPGTKVATSYRLIPPSSTVLDGYLYSIRGIGAVALLKFAHNAPKSLARPNVNATAKILNALGLIPRATLVTETVVFVRSAQRLGEFRFAIASRVSDEYSDDVLFPRFIAALAIERMILDNAIESLTSNFVSTRHARRLTANIRFWISHPAIESSELRMKFHGIRDALDLDRRSSESLEALGEIVKRGNTSFFSGSATTAALLTVLGSTQFGAPFGAAWPIVSVVGGLAVWLFVRGFRF